MLKLNLYFNMRSLNFFKRILVRIIRCIIRIYWTTDNECEVPGGGSNNGNYSTIWAQNRQVETYRGSQSL